MKSSLLLPSILGCLGVGLWLTAPSDEKPEQQSFDLNGFSSATAELAEKVLAATVSLYVDRADGSAVEEEVPPGGRARGFGSGFVIDAIRGYVVTNQHVAGDKDANITVLLPNGKKVTGDVLGADPKTDLAVVKIPEGAVRRQLSWGDSEALRPGNLVMAVGSPLRVTGTTSIGVVSGINRNIDLESVELQDFIQFDAFIDRGSSGGPLVDMNGKIVGVNTAIYGQDGWRGVSYAVPTLMAQGIVRDLLEYGRPRRGYLGAVVAEVSARYAEQHDLPRVVGVRVREVVGEAAQNAGLKRGDVILAINNRYITSPQVFRARVSTFPPDTRIRLEIWRDGKRKFLNAVLTEAQ